MFFRENNISSTEFTQDNIKITTEFAQESENNVMSSECTQESWDENYKIPIEIETPYKEIFTFEETSGSRRIIDIDHFLSVLKHIKEHCAAFSCTISNLIPVKETRHGLNSKIYFKCNMCNVTLDMSTTTNDNDKMDLNYAAVLGAVITGNGYAQLAEWTSAMDIPFMSEWKYQKIEEKVGNDIISTAETTMKEAIDEEKEAAFKRGDVDTDGFALITVVTDGVWARDHTGMEISLLWLVVQLS